MANAEQLAILNQGVEVWNKWRKENQNVEIDLSGADFIKINLRGVLLMEGNLTRINLHESDLWGANLSGVILNNSDLGGVNLREANLWDADLTSANLSRVNLKEAQLSFANLKETYLNYADLNGTILFNTNFSKAHLSHTLLKNLDLESTIGLDEIKHDGPSIIDISVFQQTRTPLPKEFTRGCGWQDWMVKSMELQNPALLPDQVVDVLYEVERLRNGSPLQVHNLFISHSRKDATFIEFIGKQLEQRNILYWLDVRDATAGPLEKQIDKAIRLNQTFLLVLSKHSCESDWVEWELDKARQLEKEIGRHVICPIELDRSWENGNLSERIKLQIKKYNVLDFSQWQDSSIFAKQFERLIKGLDLFYKPA